MYDITLHSLTNTYLPSFITFLKLVVVGGAVVEEAEVGVEVKADLQVNNFVG